LLLLQPVCNGFRSSGHVAKNEHIFCYIRYLESVVARSKAWILAARGLGSWVRILLETWVCPRLCVLCCSV
jgi:hypothetical protein